MLKVLWLFLCLPVCCMAQVNISGRVINYVGGKPLPNANIFLSNSTIGTKTTEDGTFSLMHLQPGKYVLVVSSVGFESYSQNVTVDRTNVQLADIKIFPKTIALTEVSIRYHKDPDREKYLGWFKDEFLGTSERAKNCKLLNPELLDLSYDEISHKLTASSSDYLEIENDDLGYKIKYLITDFSFENKSDKEKKISYKGPIQFEELKGTLSKKNKWIKNREQLYERSPMHFLRAALNNTIAEEGFRVQKEINIVNPDRPLDSLINAKLNFFKQAKKAGDHYASDSLSLWTRLSRLTRTIPKTINLTAKDLIAKTDQPGMFMLIGDTSKVYIAYNKSRRFYVKNTSEYLYNANNDELTLIVFNSPPTFFYSNGIIVNPYSLTYYGVWGRNRVAELLPIDYSSISNVELNNKLSYNLISKIDTFVAKHPVEKTYLQFDKPYYAAGDTIYFKAYVSTSGSNALSNLSGILHVDLVRPDSKVQQSLILHLDSGITWGDFPLPDSLLKGNFHIRAYTMLMRTDSTLVPFDKIIPIGSLQAPKIVEAAASNFQQKVNLLADIQFFPEGGKLAIGIRSKVAFKALGANGICVELKGVIEDDDGKAIVEFKSAHLGMGYFYFLPESGKTYVAKIIYANGEKTVVKLPITEDGIVLSVSNNDDVKVTVDLSASKDYFENNKNKSYTVVVFSGGTVTTINCKLDHPAVKLEIEKSNLRTGIATFTLFSNTYEPLCERLLFIDDNDQLNLKINDNKNSFAKREKVTLNLNVSDSKNLPVKGHFSAAVINESLVTGNSENDNNILTYFLLTSDLKGYVEQPGYYFTDKSAIVKDNLDILMLTQGFRRFEWKNVLAADQSVAGKPEKGLEISGMVKSLSGRPVVKGVVTLIKPDNDVMSSITDVNGVFHFPNLVFNDTAKFILSAVNAAGKNSTKITWDTAGTKPVFKSHRITENTLPDTALIKYLINAKKEMYQQFRYGKKAGILLKEVKIKAIKRVDQYNTQSLAGAGHANQVLHSKDILGGPLSDALSGLLKGVTLVNRGFMSIPYLTSNIMSAIGGNLPTPMLLIVDGTIIISDPKSPPDINQINTSDVETIEVLSAASASIYGMNGAGGVLIITTKQGGGINAKNVQSVGILPIKVAGFYKAREFYSPKYNNSSITVGQHDFRSTIYWQPEVITDKKGNAAFDYFNADGTGTYKVIVEGMDDNGRIGRLVFSYLVK